MATRVRVQGDLYHPPGDCTSRSRILDGRTPEKARYRWHCQNGHIARLCVHCCALWRQNAEEDPTLAPARIVEIATVNPHSPELRSPQDPGPKPSWRAPRR